jgi:hypothetical protein
MMELAYAKASINFDPMNTGVELGFPAKRYDNPDQNLKTYTY